MRLAALSLLLPTLALGQGQVGASVQTSPALVGTQVAAAGVAFYVTPDGGVAVLANDADSTQIQGLQAYDVNGVHLEAFSNSAQLAVDVRYGFGFATKGDVIMVVDSNGTISLLGPTDTAFFGPLTGDGTSSIPTLFNPSSAALGWHQGALFAYLGAFNGTIEQWLIDPVSAGSVNVSKVGTVPAGAGHEILAIAADELTDTLFLSIDSLGLATLPMQIDGGVTALKLLDAGVLAAPSGLSFYRQSDGGALLLGSNKNAGQIQVFDRAGNFKGSFQIVTDGGILAATAPVGNAVLVMDAGVNSFPEGVFAVVDANDPGGPVVKMVPWQKIAATFTPPLLVDTAFDVRKLPHNAPVQMMVCDAGSSDGGADGGSDAGSGGCGAGGGGGAAAGGGTGTGGSHINNNNNGQPVVDHHCGCDAGGGALPVALWLLGLALRRKLR